MQACLGPRGTTRAGKTYLLLPPTVPLEELPRLPELEPDVLLGLVVELLPGLLTPGLLVLLLELGLVVLLPELELPLARARASQSCFAMPVSVEHWLRSVLLPALLPVLGVVVVLPVPGVVLLGLEVLGLVVLGLVVDDPPIEPLELEVCATETPAAPRNAAATAAQRSLLVIVSLL